MPNDLLERPKGNEYDDDWQPGSSQPSNNDDGLEDSWNANNSGYDGSDPTSKAKKPKSLDGDQISNAEKKAGDTKGGNAEGLPGEKSLPGASDMLGKGFTGAGAASSVASAFFKKRSTKVGGGLAGAGVIGIVFTSFFASSMYLVHLKEMATGRVNQFANLRNTSFEKRRGKSLVKYISSKRANKLFINSFETKAASAGIGVVKDEATGKITKLVSNETNKVVAEFEDGLTKKGFGQFMETEAGRAFANDIDSIAPSLASEWRGVAAKKNFLTRLKLSMVNIFDRAPPDADATPREKIDLALANAEETNEKALIDEAKAQDQLAKDSGVDPSKNPQDGVGSVIDENTQGLVDEFGDEVKSNPAEAVSKLEGAGADILKEFGEGAASAAAAGDNIAFGTILKSLTSNLAKRGATLILSTVNALAIPQYACKLKGTINFLSNTKSVLLTYELAKFATRIMVSGSEQQAGIVKSESAKLAALFMSNATSSGGMRWMSGDSTAKVSASNLSKYSTGGNATGLLGSLKKFANGVPGVGSTTCSFVNNGLVTVAGIAVGVVAFIFGGGESGASESNGLFAAGLQVGIDLALAITTPLFVRMVTRQVMTAVTDNLSVGDAFAAGSAALAASNGSANGALIIKQSQAVALQREAESYRKIELARTSIFDRYINMARGDSLVHQLAFSAPSGGAKNMILDTTALASRVTTAFTNPIAQLTSIFSSKNSKAYAAIGSDQCDDPYLKRNDIVTDPFCNPLVANVPNLDLDRTEAALLNSGNIDSDGKPIPGSELDSYIKNCLSGRSALLYKENISRDGNDGNGEDQTCIDPGIALAGDFPETIYAMRDMAKPSLWDKLTGNSKAFAAAEDEIRTPGRNERFALWYGYLVDSENLEQDITGVYPDDVNTTGSAGSGIVSEGLNGYTIPCTGLPNTPRTQGARPGTINWDSIPNSGSIGTASNGKPIYVFIRDSCSKTDVKTVIIASSIHGTENGGQPITFELLFNKTLPDNLRIIAIPEVNPTGISKDPGRVNANGVNLNRNFDFNWSSLDTAGVGAKNNYSGTSPASEPETKAIQTFLSSIKDNALLISYHSNLGYIAASSTEGLKASKAYYDYIVSRGITSFANTGGKSASPVVPQHGGLDAWYGNKLSKPSMLIELLSQSEPDNSSTHADAVINLARVGAL